MQFWFKHIKLKLSRIYATLIRHNLNQHQSVNCTKSTHSLLNISSHNIYKFHFHRNKSIYKMHFYCPICIVKCKNNCSHTMNVGFHCCHGNTAVLPMSLCFSMASEKGSLMKWYLCFFFFTPPATLTTFLSLRSRSMLVAKPMIYKNVLYVECESHDSVCLWFIWHISCPHYDRI